MFAALGILVGVYTLYAAYNGEVFVKSGASGRTVTRTDEPRYFWACIAIYAGLSVALCTVF